MSNVPKVGDQVKGKNVNEAVVVDRVSHSSEPESNADIRHNNLRIVVVRKHDGAGHEV